MLILALFSAITSALGLSCMDDKGSSTDSWTILKAPQTGDSFLYASAEEDLYSPSYSLNDTSQGALSLTLNQLWNSEVNYVLFNDEPPNVSTYNYTVGHTKGILAVDSEAQTGFYIVHSFPQWPSGPQSKNSYGGLSRNLWTYGQNAYCVSLLGKTIDLLAYSFRLTLPLIYESRITDGVSKTLPNLTALVGGAYSTAAICVNHPIPSAGGKAYTLFSKSTQWNKDLWFSCVAPYFKKDLVVESWIRGSAIGPSCTGTYEVLDASEVSFNTEFTWSEYNDHSKWASSSDGEIACHGDINRMTTQFTRGGGALCFSPLYNLMNAVSKENSC
jgi:deoxyribonuclease-2